MQQLTLGCSSSILGAFGASLTTSAPSAPRLRPRRLRHLAGQIVDQLVIRITEVIRVMGNADHKDHGGYKDHGDLSIGIKDTWSHALWLGIQPFLCSTLWKSMEIHGNSWKFMELCISMGVFLSARSFM